MSTDKEMRRSQRLLLSNPEEHHRDWWKLFSTIPCRILKPNVTKRGWLKVGLMNVREVHAGIRFQVPIWQSPKGQLHAFGLQSAILNNTNLRGDHGGWRDIIGFDSLALKESFLDWILEVWQNALVQGGGWLPYQSQRLCRAYVYYYVSSDGHLEPNCNGAYPWTRGRFGPGDDDIATQLASASKRWEVESGRSPGYSDTHGLTPDSEG